MTNGVRMERIKLPKHDTNTEPQSERKEGEREGDRERERESARRRMMRGRTEQPLYRCTAPSKIDRTI